MDLDRFRSFMSPLRRYIFDLIIKHVPVYVVNSLIPRYLEKFPIDNETFRRINELQDLSKIQYPGINPVMMLKNFEEHKLNCFLYLNYGGLNKLKQKNF